MVHLRGPAILDVNTQYDLFDPQGAYALRQTQALVPAMEKLFFWLKNTRLPVVSTRLHGVIMPDPNFHEPICLANTHGYAKLDFTLLPERAELPVDCGTDLPVDAFQSAQQYIFDLPDVDLFNSPRLDRLLSETEAALWLILGGPLESTVRMAVMGLIQRRQKVALVKDCLARRDLYEGEMAKRQVESKNVQWLSAEEIIQRYSRRPLRRGAALGRRRFGRTIPAGARLRLPRYRSHVRLGAGPRSAVGGGRFRWSE